MNRHLPIFRPSTALMRFDYVIMQRLQPALIICLNTESPALPVLSSGVATQIRVTLSLASRSSPEPSSARSFKLVATLFHHDRQICLPAMTCLHGWGWSHCLHYIHHGHLLRCSSLVTLRPCEATQCTTTRFQQVFEME